MTRYLATAAVVAAAAWMLPPPAVAASTTTVPIPTTTHPPETIPNDPDLSGVGLIAALAGSGFIGGVVVARIRRRTRSRPDAGN